MRFGFPTASLPLGLVVALASGCAADHASDASAEAASELSGGTIENDSAYPWRVTLSGTTAYDCNGILIADRWVLTAAHCLEGSYGGVTVSYSRTTTRGRLRTVVVTQGPGSTFKHPLYDGIPSQDLGLVRLPAPFPADPLLRAAELPLVRPALGAPVVIAANGALTSGKVATTHGVISDDCFPASDETCVATGAARACEGDSGSGVIAQVGGVNYVAGIVSSVAIDPSTRCAAVPTVTATDVMQYMDWIRATMQSAPPAQFTANFRNGAQLYSGLDFGLPSSWETITGDFDGDRRVDYARVGSTGAWLYFGNADGTFSQGFQDYGGLAFGMPSEWTTIVGDFDGDGRKDYARIGNTGAWVFSGNADRTFRTSFQNYDGLDFGLPSSWQVSVGDFDGDGLTDYLRLGNTGAWLFYGARGGGFSRGFQAYPGLDFGLPSTWQLVTNDFDGDGRADYARLGDTGAFVYFGNGDRTFTLAFQNYDGLAFGIPSGWEAITGDFDGDGRKDYIRLGDTGAWVYSGNRDRSFTRSFQDYQGSSFGYGSSWTTIVGDFSGDGRTDYARIGDTAGYFYFGSSNGVFGTLFQQMPRHFGQPSAFSTAVGDFNGDGKADYARLGGVFAEVFVRN